MYKGQHLGRLYVVVFLRLGMFSPIHDPHHQTQPLLYRQSTGIFLLLQRAFNDRVAVLFLLCDVTENTTSQNLEMCFPGLELLWKMMNVYDIGFFIEYKLWKSYGI